MLLADIARLALNGIFSRKLRSGLTALGIIVGSGAFVALVTLGSTVEESIAQQLDALDADQLQITPGATEVIDEDGGGPPQFVPPAQDISFSLSDQEAVERAPGIIGVHGQTGGRAVASFRGETARLNVVGVDPAQWQRIQDPELGEGRLLSPNEGKNVVLGFTAAAELFDVALELNQQISINDVRYRVVGVLAEKDGRADENIYMSRDEAWTVLDKDETLNILVAKRSPLTPEDEAVAAVEQALLRSRGLNPDEIDFTIVTAADIQEQIEDITATVRVFLGSISGVSLVVGGIGIANTMFMTVMERSRQIGILKAVGMPRREVIALFLIESALLGALGGLIGAFLGTGAAVGLTLPGTPFDNGVPATPDPMTIMNMTLFSIGIGSIAGVIPAVRASSVPAVESLEGVA